MKHIKKTGSWNIYFESDSVKIAVFWIRDILVPHRSRSGDPYLLLTDPDPASDPALFVSDLPYANKI